MLDKLTLTQAQQLPLLNDVCQLEDQMVCATEIEMTLNDLMSYITFAPLPLDVKRRLFAGLAHLAMHLAQQTALLAAEIGGRLC
jgi:hypothetical protein